MRRIQFLQVGDIHYPEWKTIYSNIDAKDGKFSPSIASDLRGSAFRCVLAKLNQFARSGRLACIAFMGDFTSRGELAFLDAAFQHFTLLCKPAHGQKKLPLIFVPGNHDVNREEAFNLGPVEKFSRVRQLAEDLGWVGTPVDEPLSLTVNNGTAVSTFVLMNTAIGSWELQNLPELLRDKLKVGEASDAPIDLGTADASGTAPATPIPPTNESKPATLLSQYYGQLDTPYVSSRMLSDTMDHLNHQRLPFGVVVAHHNLLPQKIPRLSPYSELLNGGFVRSQFLSTNKPIVFLHGHTHQDPIEVISDPRFPDGKIISISAPEIQKGFNEIVLFLTEQNELLGLRVVPHRASVADGLTVIGQHCFIPTLQAGKIFLAKRLIPLTQVALHVVF